MPENLIKKVYLIEDRANYNRIVQLANGHTVKFNEFSAEVNEEDVDYFNKMDDFQVKFSKEVIFKALTEELLAKSPVRAIIEVEGLLYGASGFAEALRNVTVELYRKGCIVVARPSDNPFVDNVNVISTEKGKIIQELAHLQYLWGDLLHVPKISIQMTVPLGIKRKRDAYTIGYVMYETQSFLSQFIQHLNNEVDELWTPSTFNFKNIQEAGWTKSIFCIPLGVDVKRFDPSKYKPFDSSESPVGNYSDRFIFLCVCGFSARKGVNQLFEAYLREFKKNEKVVLYIKGGWYDQNKADDEIRSAIAQYNFGDTPLIVTDFRIYEDEEHPRLYKSSNCFVLPSYGEGWSLGHSEAMAMALPVIGTRATAMIDYQNDENSFPVNVGAYASDPRTNWVAKEYENALFSIPDVNDLRRQMRFIFDNQKKAKEVGRQARIDMKNKWTWGKASEIQVERLKEIVKTL